ncbi:MAG: RNase adapter RapZ [Candidatus Eremiobacteraeota bacterium]|nr:RNase adapter RapZ [Candidatus Eremiobacteraeota bacterium]
MKSFEDLGFYCLDNLPPALVPELVTLAERAGIRRVALSLDVRVGGAFGEAAGALDELERREIAVDLLFLDADDATIVRRYSETRRRHPADCAGGLAAAIARERATLAALRDRATRVWDTSGLTQTTLKTRIVETFDGERAERLDVRVVAFGFKNGVPLDADLMFDVRFFTNPNYVPELKPLTGRDVAVARFIEALPETEPFLERLFGTIDFLVPLYAREGKSRLTIAIGCTGGRHRSVYVARRLAAHLAAHDGIAVTVDDRELPQE